MTAHGALPALIDVIVLVDAGIVTEEHEFVAVAAIAKCRGCLLPEILLAGGEPVLSPLPGWEVPVELVATEGTIAAGKDQVAVPQTRSESRFGRRGAAAEIAIGNEPGREVAISCNRLREIVDEK